MALRSILQSGLPVDYYAPDYEIRVENRVLDETTKGDILDVTVTMEKDQLTGFSLNINNWDDKNFKFKYSNCDTFDVCNRVFIKMGYTNKLRAMTQGLITSMTPRFPASGPPTIAVNGSDALFKLRDRKPGPKDNVTFAGLTDWQIASKVAKRNHIKFKATEEGKPHDIVVQKDQDDLTFLMERAKRIDFECFIRVDPDTGEDVLHFVKPTDARGGGPIRVYVFEWGKSLISFNPQLKIGEQVGTVTVGGWDFRTKKRISYTAEPKDLPEISGGHRSGPAAVQKCMPEKKENVPDQPVTSHEELRDLAIALLRERAYEYLTGTGQVIGIPDLRPGDNVELKGLGKRFSLTYYVKKVVHTLGSSGYLTDFEVRSPFDGGIELDYCRKI
jgi:phage protein D